MHENGVALINNVNCIQYFFKSECKFYYMHFNYM
jgi:hypothetical protein